MITPAEIVRKAERLYIPFLRAWLQGESFFPQVLPVGRLPADYLELSAAVARLLKGAKTQRRHGYTVQLRRQHTQRHGAQSLPACIMIDSDRDLLSLIGKEEEFATFTEDVALLREHVPQLQDWLIRYPQQVIEHHGVWPDLLRVCVYFLAHPRPNCYIRELPIAVHTKFIETHAGILRRLLDAVLPAAAFEPAAAAFEQRFGLRYDEPVIRMRFLDEQLQRRYNLPVSDFTTPLSQFAALGLRGHRCVVTENK